MKVSATTTPSGANATLMPAGSRYWPSQPFDAYSAVSAMPATAVGSAKGRSTSAETRRLPGNSVRTSTQAINSPNTALISAAIAAAPKLRR